MRWGSGRRNPVRLSVWATVKTMSTPGLPPELLNQASGGEGMTGREMMRELSKLDRALVEIGAPGFRYNGHWRANADSPYTVPQLRDGLSAVKAFNEIANQEPLVVGVLRAIEALIRRVEWRFETPKDKPDDQKAVEFLEQCRDDMARPWTEFISDALTMIWAGFSLTEICYKRRSGSKPHNPSADSVYDDGLIGWSKFAPRAQTTIWQWVINPDTQDLVAVRQLAPPKYSERVIPMSKMMRFSPGGDGGNPWGNSLLKGCYEPWFMLKRLRPIEGISIERELAGLPIAKVPAELLSETASPEEKATLAAIHQMVANVRVDAQAGVVWPLSFDENGNELYRFELIASAGGGKLSPHETITRYEQRLVTSLLADFMMLGQGEGAGGSWSMATNKSALFTRSLEAILDVIAQEVNRKAIPALWRLNGWDPRDAPKLAYGSVAEYDIVTLTTALSNMMAAGFPIAPEDPAEPGVQDFLYTLMGLPARSDATRQMAQLAAQSSQAEQLAALGIGPDGQPLPQEDPMAGVPEDPAHPNNPMGDPEAQAEVQGRMEAKQDIARRQTYEEAGMADPNDAEAAGEQEAKGEIKRRQTFRDAGEEDPNEEDPEGQAEAEAKGEVKRHKVLRSAGINPEGEGKSEGKAEDKAKKTDEKAKQADTRAKGAESKAKQTESAQRKTDTKTAKLEAKIIELEAKLKALGIQAKPAPKKPAPKKPAAKE